MTEIEYNVKAFIDAAMDKKDKKTNLFYSIVYKNKTFSDVIPNHDEDIVKSISKLLQDKKKINNVLEIQIKSQTDNTVELINTIEIK